MAFRYAIGLLQSGFDTALTDLFTQDFRSEEGLYSLIQAQRDAASLSRQSAASLRRKPLATRSYTNPNHSNPLIPTNVKGKDLFDAQVWQDPTSTSVFYTFIASLRRTIQESIHNSTATHRFIKTLRDRGNLVRCYTQNIDGLESRLGLSADLGRGKGNRARFTKQALEKPKALARTMPGGDMDGGCEVVQLHGDLESLRCTLCQQTCQWKEEEQHRLQAGKAPTCHFCLIANEDRENRGKRSTKIGTLRPNIVLYGEEHPSADAVGNITAHDLVLSPDVLLILGTSLHVHGLKVLVKEFSKAVHARAGGKGKVVFVNLSKPSESAWKDVIDFWVPMDCDAWVGAMRRHRPDIWQIQGELKTRVIKTASTPAPKTFSKPLYTHDDGEDKENVTFSVHTTPKKPPKPMVLISPAKKPPLQDQAATLACRLQQAINMNGMVDEQTLLDSRLQLPTPPSTGHRSKIRGLIQKRRRTNEEDDSIGTPSKRRIASVSIWEDPDTGFTRRQMREI